MKIIEKGNGNKDYEEHFKETAEYIYKIVKPIFKKSGIPFDGILIRRGNDNNRMCSELIFSVYKAGGDNDNFVEYTHNGINLDVGFSFKMKEVPHGTKWDSRFLNVTSWHQAKDETIRKQVFKVNQQRGAVMHTNHANTDGSILKQIDFGIAPLKDNIANYLEFLDDDYRLNIAVGIIKSGQGHELTHLLENLSEELWSGSHNPIWRKIIDNIFDIINNGDKRRAKKLVRLFSQKGSLVQWCENNGNFPCEALYEETKRSCFVSKEAADLFLF